MLVLLRHAHNKEQGFTLIELLVVMIIIGILAAVAVPIFLNQQKTAKDTSVTSDVRQVATTIKGLLVANPDATDFSISTRGTGADSGKAQVTAGGQTASVTLTKDIVIAVEGTGIPGEYRVYGWSASGKSYATKALVYDSANGGLQKTPVDIPTALANSGSSGDGSGGGSTPVASDPTNIATVRDLTDPTKPILNVTWTPAQNKTVATYRIRYDTYRISDNMRTSYTWVDRTPSSVCTTSQCAISQPGNTSTTVYVEATVTATYSDGTTSPALVSRFN